MKIFYQIFMGISLLGMLISPVAAEVSLQKRMAMITTEWKSYTLPKDEPISLYGAKRRHFVTDHFYWGEAGYGALTGKRSGYLEGGVITGFLAPLTDQIVYDFRLFAGAGGGGSAPQGGGMILNPTVGLGMEFKKGHLLMFEYGYIKFLNGDIESHTLAISYSLRYWELFGH